MKLIYKFSLPSLIQAALILALLLYMAVAGNTLIDNLKEGSNRINQSSEQLNNIINQTDKYFLEKITQQGFSDLVQSTLQDFQTQKGFDTRGIVTGLNEIDSSIRKADELRSQNAGHIGQILELTKQSMGQSNGYIKLTVGRLADPKQKDQVSTLERMVIQGANNNTTANMKIQVLLYQMLKEFSKKSDLLGFIKHLLENVEKDVEALQGTPFAGMPVKAKEANLEVERLVNQYIANIESIGNIEKTIRQRSTSLQKSLRDIEMASMEFTFSEITGLGILLAVFLIVLSLLLIIVGFLITRIVTLPLLNLNNTVTAIVENEDFSTQIANPKTDEIGETIEAFNSLMNTLYASISDVNRVMESVNNGDFTMQVTREHKGDLNRLKESINGSIEGLSKTINQVVHASEQVNTGSKELSSSAQTLASGTTEQAASLEEISSSMSEVGGRANANKENANQASQLTSQTLEIVNRGNKQMEDMLTSMDEISSSSTDISKIIKVIDEIAFQTNLLALNAAVEAARAGKYGKGFAVVAEEVRSLAARSAEAAKNTTELIENSAKEVESGVSNAGKTAEILKDIDESIAKVNELVSEIAAASHEQSSSTDEVNKALTLVNNVIQQNSSISEEAASASEELSGQAMELQKQMNRFKVRQTVSESKPLQNQEGSPDSQSQSPVPLPEIESKKPAGSPKLITLDDDDFGKY